jgi:hypothetical protein
MRHVLTGAAVLLAVRLASAGDAGVAPLPACILVKTESRYVPYGYNHIVAITNGCSKAARCSVATDVNPARQSVDVPAMSAVEVTTFQGAAASSFVANVTCALTR